MRAKEPAVYREKREDLQAKIAASRKQIESIDKAELERSKLHSNIVGKLNVFQATQDVWLPKLGSRQSCGYAIRNVWSKFNP